MSSNPVVENVVPGQRYPRQVLETFALELMHAAGVDDAQAETLTENLLWNDAAGRANHGLERLEILLRRVHAGLIQCPAPIRFQRLGPSAAHLDAGHGLGQHAGRLGIDHAIEMAGEAGLAGITVNASNFFGTGAYFVARAVDAGMIGLAFSNSFPKVAAHNGLRPILGTNPLAFGAPLGTDRRLLVDMSTAALAGSTLRTYQTEAKAMPAGLAIDETGVPVTDPAQASSSTLLPVAGPKGFGLGLMVELLAGVLTGAGMSSGVGSLYKDFDRKADNGHFFLVIDIARFMPADMWQERAEWLAHEILSSAAAGDVRLPGDRLEQSLKDSLVNGIPLSPKIVASLTRMSKEYGLSPPDVLSD